MFSSLIAKYHALQDKRANGDGGFTLIELLVVVVIIGILIAIAIPLYLNYQHGAKDKSAMSDLRAAIATVNQCYADNNSSAYPTGAAGNGAGGDLTFTCSGTTEVAKASGGTTLTYQPVSNGFQLYATNSGGSGVTYKYDSTAGGSIAGSTTAAPTGAPTS